MKVFVNIGWEVFVVFIDFVVEVVVVCVIELDFVVDGEFECIEGLKC